MGEGPNKSEETLAREAAIAFIRERKESGYNYFRIIDEALVTSNSAESRGRVLNENNLEIVKLVEQEIARRKAKEAK